MGDIAAMKQWYCIIGGQQYGPVSEEELRNWAQAGRIKLTDQVWSEGMPAWAPASAVGGIFGTDGNPPPVLKPHRGGGILALGIVGIVPCFICGIIAWVMAKKDLAEMAAGKMDPAGQGMTNAGKICGIVGVCFWSAYLLIYVCIIVFVVIVSATAAATSVGH